MWLYGDEGRSTSLAQVYQPTANGLLNTYRQVYGEEYMLNKVRYPRRHLILNGSHRQVCACSAMLQRRVMRPAAAITLTNLSAYNGGGYAAAV